MLWVSHLPWRAHTHLCTSSWLRCSKGIFSLAFWQFLKCFLRCLWAHIENYRVQNWGALPTLAYYMFILQPPLMRLSILLSVPVFLSDMLGCQKPGWIDLLMHSVTDSLRQWSAASSFIIKRIFNRRLNGINCSYPDATAPKPQIIFIISFPHNPDTKAGLDCSSWGSEPLAALPLSGLLGCDCLVTVITRPESTKRYSAP